MLQRISDDFASNVRVAKKMSGFLEILRKFLRQQYDHHASKVDDAVHTHGVLFGLEKPRERVHTRTGICNACNFIRLYFRELKAILQDAANKPRDVLDDAVKVVTDIETKMEIYRGHRIRVTNQRPIQALHLLLERKCKRGEPTKHAVVVMDWKMKFETMSARETTEQHFDKRGIGWHVFIASYYILEGDEVIRYTVYCDQIMDGTNKQDNIAVASMVEVFLWQLHKELPFIESVTLQSDNAGCYQSNELLHLLPVISKISPITISRFLHTETQDGRALTDKHFARSTSHIEKFMKTSQRNKIRK